MNKQVVVCGGGPAGAAAAIAAARRGADVLLIERGGALGGTLTASLVGCVLDGNNKTGIAASFLSRVGEEIASSGASLCEAEKYVFETMCRKAGVDILYHALVCGARLHEDFTIASLTVAVKGGLLDIEPDVVIDATGDGDVAYSAGIPFETGNEQGITQPLSMIAVVAGLNESDVRPFIAYPEEDFWACRKRFSALLASVNVTPSTGIPTLSKINDSLFFLSVNHEYGVRCDDPFAISRATTDARREVFETVRALRNCKGFEHITLAATPEHIGVREGRRFEGQYTVTLDDMLAGRRHEDAVCTVTYWVDIHALTKDGNKSFTGDEISSKPYDIPLRALLPKACGNLILAGRCLSGDFYAHASYRVAGNMLAVGEAAGNEAARRVL